MTTSNVKGISSLSKVDYRFLDGVEMVIFDFDGVFTDNTVQVYSDGTESVRCWRSDGLGLGRLKSVGIKISVLSTEKNDVVLERCRKLDVPCSHGVKDKGAAIINLSNEFAVQPSQMLYLGNDINDIPAFELVGCPICVADAYPEIYPYVKYITKAKGGRGAVREICDIIYHHKIRVPI
jgi:3-deoxy-D-manno-octulosonate 8-phosphate phosphatase (KDO 8-P phosphatase)